jgi:hypothetical protein
MGTIKPIPARLIGFAERLVRVLDANDPDRFLDADDAVQTRHASGGRIGDGVFFISYHAGEDETWSIHLDERTLRKLALGALRQIDVEVWTKPAPEPRERLGEAFAIWGRDDRARCMVRSTDDLNGIIARRSSTIFGSTHGDIVYLAFASDLVHVGAVLRGGPDGRVSTQGDSAQAEACSATFPYLAEPVPLRYSDYVPLETAHEAIRELILNGRVSTEISWTDAMFGQLLIELPQILEQRGLVVPLAKPFPPFDGHTTELAAETSVEARVEKLMSELASSGAIELTGKRLARALIDDIATILEEVGREDAPARVMDVLLEAPDVAEVFIDPDELARLLREHGLDSG